MSRSQRIAADVVASLLANRGRALLMMLGLAVGVAVLSAVIVIGQGTRAEILRMVEGHGLDAVMVRAGGDVQVFAPQADRGLASLTEADARALETIPNVELVSGVQNQRGISVVYEDRSVLTRVFGVEPAWDEIRRRYVADGEFISESDMAGMSRVAVLGVKVARELFPEGGAVGRTVRVNNDPYVVKGVFHEFGTSAGGEVDDWDDRIVVPLTTSARRLFNRPYLEQIMVRVADVQRLAETADEIRALLRVQHSIAAGQPDDFFVREPDAVEGAALEMSNTLTALLVAISLVALVAGGVVIMNLMLMGVAQRSREIGLRRALGARASDISRQFLYEAVFVSLAGGLVGVIAGVGIAAGLDAAGLAISRVTWLPFAVSLAACVAIGLAFGVSPARRAAALDPVMTLRGRAA